MGIVVYSASLSFTQFIKRILGEDIVCQSKLSIVTNNNDLYIIHAPSIGPKYKAWLRNQKQKNVKSVICDDTPTIAAMLDAVELGAKSYANSYMQASHYKQMVRLVDSGESWFPAQMIVETFAIAKEALQGDDLEEKLEGLTSKEKEICHEVAKGLSNSKIAALLNISETTVKSHLTHIFKKLDVKDRVSLVLLMKVS